MLLEPRERDLTRDELIAACLEPLVKALTTTCHWSAGRRGWKIGDYRCLALVTSVDGATFDVHWWSEPLQTVQVGAVCGPSVRAARAHMKRRQREALADLGYTGDDHPGRFWKDLLLITKEEIQAMAHEALGIFFDVYDYRGRTPLGLVVGHGTRTERQDVYQVLSFADVGKLMNQLGYDAVFSNPDGDTPSWVVHHHSDRFMVFLDWLMPGRFWAALRFVILPAERTRLPWSALNEVNAGIRFGTLYRDEDGDLSLSMDVRVDGGVTAAFLQKCFADWAGVRRVVKRRINAVGRRASDQKGRRPPRRH